MVTKNQLLRGIRKKKNISTNVPALEKTCFKKGICNRVYTVKPKKPNSGVRKVAKVILTNGNVIIVGIPGTGHKLQQHSSVLIRGGRCNDVPGVRYKMVRGAYDFKDLEAIKRKQRRSKYGVKKDGRVG